MNFKTREVYMQTERYSPPELVSYRGQDITNIAGPCQTAYTAYIDVGGGRQAMLDLGKIEYRQDCVLPEIRLVQVKVKTKTIV